MEGGGTAKGRKKYDFFTKMQIILCLGPICNCLPIVCDSLLDAKSGTVEGQKKIAISPQKHKFFVAGADLRQPSQASAPNFSEPHFYCIFVNIYWQNRADREHLTPQVGEEVRGGHPRFDLDYRWAILPSKFGKFCANLLASLGSTLQKPHDLILTSGPDPVAPTLRPKCSKLFGLAFLLYFRQ